MCIASTHIEPVLVNAEVREAGGDADLAAVAVVVTVQLLAAPVREQRARTLDRSPQNQHQQINACSHALHRVCPALVFILSGVVYVY